MFKLFKDLTRPPEPLVSRDVPSEGVSSNQSLSVPGIARPRSRSGSSTFGASDISVIPAPTAPVQESSTASDVSVESLENGAKEVTEVLKRLEGDGEVMNYVEVGRTIFAKLTRRHCHNCALYKQQSK